MSDRFAFLYQSAEEFDMDILVGEMLSAGFTLENPSTGRITHLSEEGDQVDSSLSVLKAAIMDRRPLDFQFWLAADTDLCYRARHTGDRLVEELGLVGLSQPERVRVLRFLALRFEAKSNSDNKLFLVGDQEGYSIDADWDHLSVAGQYSFPWCPDLFGLPAERMVDFSKCIENDAPIRFGRYFLCGKTVNKL